MAKHRMEWVLPNIRQSRANIRHDYRDSQAFLRWMVPPSSFAGKHSELFFFRFPPCLENLKAWQVAWLFAWQIMPSPLEWNSPFFLVSISWAAPFTGSPHVGLLDAQFFDVLQLSVIPGCPWILPHWMQVFISDLPCRKPGFDSSFSSANFGMAVVGLPARLRIEVTSL